nr:hypothetical protein [Enterobacter sp. Acro-832]
MTLCQLYRAKKTKGGGQSPQFKMRIDPALKEQLDAVAAEEGGARQLVERTGEGGVTS